MAADTDAFSIDWNTEEKPYASPPWSLLSKVLEKVAHDKVKILMVAPDWPEAEWFPSWIRMSKTDYYSSSQFTSINLESLGNTPDGTQLLQFWMENV